MKQGTGYISRILTLKSLIQRFAFLSLVVIIFAIMLIGKADTILFERLQTSVVDIFTPVLSVMATPARTMSTFVANIRELGAIREKNSELTQHNQRLLKWQAVANKLEDENRQLRRLLATVEETGVREISARVVTDPGGVFAKSVLVTAGSLSGVAKGQAVVTGEGLVGRVTRSGYRSSRILLLTDINSRIPVRVGDSGEKAVLSGDNSLRPKLTYLRVDSMVKPGDRVVTSGDAASFPPGLPVGRVIMSDNTALAVQPFVMWDRLQYVEILDFGMAGILTDLE
ncbi:MAG: rod shape-determining protein MreC [Rhodospirillaceae bacterium]|nr:rod shape-determining protein MreC [Rhodospirillaceae bacterium]